MAGIKGDRQLDLGFERAPRGRTELATRRVAYPWSLTQPFFQDDGVAATAGMATVIPQSASGGLFAGDRLRQRIAVADSAAVHVSMQGATLAHGCPDGTAIRSDWRLAVAEAARLEVLNDPVVLGPGTTLAQTWDLTAAMSARLLLIDSWTWLDVDGAPAFRGFRNDLRVRAADGNVLAVERSAVSASALHGLRATSVSPLGALATAIVAGDAGSGAGDDLRAALRAAVDDIAGCWTGVAVLPNGAGTVLRAACADAGRLLSWTETVWRVVRLFDCGAPPAARRRGL